MVTAIPVHAPVETHVLLQKGLDMTRDDVAIATAIKFSGLGLASIALIPLAYRYGRRPIYLLSSLVQISASIWLANVMTKYEYMLCSAIVGLGGASTQTLVPMTIADLFFVHQFATMNGWFLFAQSTGAFLGSLATGCMVHSHGWRWIWWWTAIFLGIAFVLILFLLEESTFMPTSPTQDLGSDDEEIRLYRPHSYQSTMEHVDFVRVNHTMTSKDLDLPPRPKTLRQRFAFITRTEQPVKERFLSPFVILVKFPAAAYAAVTYGSLVAWFALCEHVATERLIVQSYIFNAKDRDLLKLPSFLCYTIGSLVIPALGDCWMVKLAKRTVEYINPRCDCAWQYQVLFSLVVESSYLDSE